MSSPTRSRGTVVVVGASLAGLRAAEELRRLDFRGHLVLLGAETHRPYDRPPLSKALLAGEAGPEDLALRREPYGALELDLRLGVPAVTLDAADRVVHCADGATLAADGIVVATGAEPRRLPTPGPQAGMHVLRTVDDALALRAELDARPRVVVVGGGFIGAEVASTCRRRGLDVTVLEALPAPMVRGLGPVLGEVLAGLHRDHGVDLRCNAAVAAIEGGERVEAVRLADGSRVPADVVVVGIGAAPATEWLVDSGLQIDDGVVCDETLLAGPGIVAAGDVARWANPRFAGSTMRLEHWTNAAEQGPAAARRLLMGPDAPAYSPVPFVWSDQYDVKIQVVGHFRGDDEVVVVDGSPETRRFVAAVGRDGRLVGAVGFSRPAKVMALRRLVVAGSSLREAVTTMSS